MYKQLFTVLVLVLSLLLSGCDKKHEHTIKVGACPWPGYEPLFLAAQMNMYDTPIKLLRFSTPSEVYKAFKSGAVDVVALTTDELLKYADYGSVPKIFLVLDISHGADAIVVAPSIKKFEELKGKTIALEASVLSQYIMHRALEQASLSPKDITIKNIEIVEQPKAFQNKEADAFVTYEPSKSMLIQQGGHVLFDSSMIPNEVVDALAANTDTWENHQESISSIKRAWYKALNYINEHPEKAYSLMGELEGVSADVFQTSLVGLELGKYELNQELIKDKKLALPLKKLQSVLLEHKILNKRLDTLLFIGE